MPKQQREVGQEELLKRVTSLLSEAQIPYMVTGALSVIFYGRPRASHDIDFVIEAEEKDIAKITKVFQQLPHTEFIVQSAQIATAITKRNMFNILHLPTMLKLDFFLLRDEPFDVSRFTRRRQVKLFGHLMNFASPEDTILIKLLWYDETQIEKHLIDAAFVYQIQRETLDRAYLTQWADKQKTAALLGTLADIDLEQHY